MDKINKLVNTNENVITRELYKLPHCNGASNEHLIKYILSARKLIEKYEKQEWKNSVNHHHYVFKEYQICSLMDKIADYSREDVIKMIAILFGINPILLFNDADLPF